MKMPWEISERAAIRPIQIIGAVKRDLSTGIGSGRLRRWDGKECPYCKRTMRRDIGDPERLAPSRDHRVPTCRGGVGMAINIAVCCKRCNEEKGALDEEEFAAWKAGLATRLDARIPVKSARTAMWRRPFYPYRHHTEIRIQFCAITRAAAGLQPKQIGPLIGAP